MSSLAGALDLPNTATRPSTKPSDDIEMMTSPLSSADEEEDQDEAMSDLFGNDNDVEEQHHASNYNRLTIAHPEFRPAPASPTGSGPDSERLPSPERERRQALEYEEEDVPPEMAIEVKEAEVKFSNLPVPKPSDGDNWVIRVPNYVKVDSKPFHPDTYVGPEHEEEELGHGDSGRETSMSIKLKVENTLRWRWTKDAYGQDVCQRIEQSRNPLVGRNPQLRLGKELFDISQSIDTSASIPRQTLGVERQSSQSQIQTQSQSQSQFQSQSQTSATPGGKSQGLTYLVAQHKRSQVLQSEAVITGYMSLRPTGMQSETHRMLVRAVEQKHKQIARLRIAPEPTEDPERQKLDLIKQSAKKPKAKKDDADGLGGRRKRGAHRRAMDHDVMWSDDEDERGDLYGAGSEEEDYEGSTPRKAKRKVGEEKGEEDYQADDFVVPDESDDDADDPRHRRKRARDSDVEDDLERMEANLEKQAAAEKKSRVTNPKKSKKAARDDDEETEDEGAGAMDVESEEDDGDAFRVRRVTGKRTLAFAEEEDD